MKNNEDTPSFKTPTPNLLNSLCGSGMELVERLRERAYHAVPFASPPARRMAFPATGTRDI